MEKDCLKYLNTEREISEFKIEYLKKMLHKGDASTKRLLAIEEEFLNIPFEKIASSLSELLSAIKIFRESRTAFHDFYKEEPKIAKSEYALDLFNKSLKEKILELNENISHLKIKSARDTARVLTILLCILFYIDESKNKVLKMNLSINEGDLLTEISNKYEEDIFIFYNYIIENVNDFDFLNERSKQMISEIKKLDNICFNSDEKYLSIISKTFRGKKIFGFFLPSKHSGRETLRPYYMSLFDEDGFSLSKLFLPIPRAVILDDEYYKFITLVSPNEIKDNIVLLEKYEQLMKKIFHLKLSGKKDLRIDIKSSKILIPCSRTEDEGIRSALSESSAIFSNILTSIL